MAERNATIKLSIRPDADPAAPLKAVANASKTASAAVRNVKKDVADLVGPARSAALIMSDLFLASAKKAKENKAKVDELTGAIKQLGLTTQQVQGMARQLGREFGVSTREINKALAAAGQAPMAFGRGGRGGSGFFGRLGGFGVGGFSLAFAGSAIASAAREGLQTGADDDIHQGAIERAGEHGGVLGRANQAIFGNSFGGDLLTFDARREAAESGKAVERARARLDANRARILERLQEQDRDARDRAEIEALRSSGRDRAELAGFSGAAALGRAGALGNAGVRAGLLDTRTGATAAGLLGVQGGLQVARAQQAAALGRFGGDRASVAAVGPGASVRQQQSAILQGELELLGRRRSELEKARAAEERIADLTLQQARLQADLTKAKGDELREQADKAKAEAAATRSSMDQAAIAFGGQTGEQQQAALEAARRFKQGGIGALSPEELSGLRGTGLFGGELDQAARERAGRSGFGELLGLSGAEGRAAAGEQRAADLQRAADQVKIQADVTLAFDEARIQAALEKALRAFDSRIEEIVVRVQAANRAKEKQAQFQPVANR
jgi:hypothetical protein